MLDTWANDPKNPAHKSVVEGPHGKEITEGFLKPGREHVAVMEAHKRKRKAAAKKGRRMRSRTWT